MPLTPNAGINKKPNIKIGFNIMFKRNLKEILLFSKEMLYLGKENFENSQIPKISKIPKVVET